MKATAAAMFLLLFLGWTSILTEVVHATNGETIYIKLDGTVDPATASIQREGNLYIFDLNINTPIVVQRDDIVIDGKGFTLQGSGTHYGISLENLRNVTIRNVKIMGFSAGIKLESSTQCTLVNNTITSCVYGILPSNSPNTTIIGNLIANNQWDGIFLWSSDNSAIDNNVVVNHDKWGIYLGDSHNIILRNNTMMENRWNLGVSAKFLHNIDVSNTVDGKPVYYWTNQYNKQVPQDAGYVAIINSSNVTLKGLSLTKNGQGVLIVNSDNCLVENSTIAFNGYYGVQLSNSHHNTIKGNTIENNTGYGGIGVAMMKNSSTNVVSNNLIANNELGISFHDSEANRIYHNNLVNNTRQAFSAGSTNYWDNGYPSGGNYWSDYAGIDANNDEIGDEPYAIDEINLDRYPFTGFFSKRDFALSNIDIAFAVAIVTLGVFLAAIIISQVIKRRKKQTSS